MIGVFDSGLGGLGVLAAVRDLEPSADLVALADQANAPYGDRSADEVVAFTVAATDRLAEAGCRTVVVACNTASTAALEVLRRRRPDQTFVGMEPAVKPAAALTRSGVIAVLGTTATIEGRLLAGVVDRHAGNNRVIGVPLPGLVELVEDGLGDTTAAASFVAERVAPALAAGADTFVLACTHYGLARAAIDAAVDGATVVDPAEAVARQALRVTPSAGESGSTLLLTTADPVRMRRQVGLLLGWDVAVEPVRLSVPARPG